MSFDSSIGKSVSRKQFIFEYDIPIASSHYVNAGAGVWKVSPGAIYPEVATELNTFASVAFSVESVQSMRSNWAPLVMVSSLSALTTAELSFYPDIDNSILYFTIQGFDDPHLYQVFIGQSSGFVKGDSFTSGGVRYEGRIKSLPSLARSCDPLFYGRSSFPGGAVTLANEDRAFDSIAGIDYFYGAAARIYIGFPGDTRADWQQVFSGYIDRHTISREELTVEIRDIRKTFTKSVTPYYGNWNAVMLIKELLLVYYNIAYSEQNYDLTEWTAAAAISPAVGIYYTEETPLSEIIEYICQSVAGQFITKDDGRFTFRFDDSSATASSTISRYEILNYGQVDYSTDDVVSSLRIGYSRNWGTDEYTYYTDTSQEAAVYSRYHLYIQKDFDTALETATAASALASAILAEYTEVRGTVSLSLPLSKYALELNDLVNVEFYREVNSFLGTKKCQVRSKTYNLNSGVLEIGVRIIE